MSIPLLYSMNAGGSILDGATGEEREALLIAYRSEQAAQTLSITRFSAWVGIPAILFLMLQDTFVTRIGWISLLRLIGLVPCFFVLVKAYTVFERDTTTVIRDHCIMLSLVMTQICLISYVLWRLDPEGINYQQGTTHGITTAILVAFLVIGGGRRFLLLVLGIPFLILTILLLTASGRELADLSLFVIPAVTLGTLSIYSASREDVVFSEFAMRRLAARQEEKLKRSAEALSRTNAELRGFAHTASHDLKQPLLSISGFLDIIHHELGQEGLLKDSIADFFGRVQGAAHRMSELIDSMLVYSRATSRETVFSIVDLNQLLDAVKDDLHSAIQNSGATIESTPLPNVHGDFSQLACVLQNLIANSIKYAKAGEAPLIRISASDEENVVRIVITDNGIGFDPGYASALFDAFRRLHEAGDHEGVGLGLAICRKYIERHGGEIGATGEPGVGATFWFTVAKQSACSTESG